MSNLKSAASSLFGTVSTTAEALSSVVNTAAEGVHLVGDYVSAARIRQQIDIRISLGLHEINAINTATLEQAKRAKETKTWLETHPDMADEYIATRERLTALFAKA
jgi:methyl-accepting chemotaxis protein